MDSGRIVRVTDDCGNEHIGRCWAYSAATSELEYGIAEPIVDVGPGLLLFISEIKKIEYVDE